MNTEKKISVLELERDNTKNELEKLEDQGKPLEAKRIKLTDAVRKETAILDKYTSLKHRAKDIAQDLKDQDWL